MSYAPLKIFKNIYIYKIKIIIKEERRRRGGSWP
jgi:hypothetical protein